MDYHIKINGIDVEASFSEANIEQIFLPLLDLFQRMRKEKGRRILVMLAAPPAAGKSTLASFLQTLSESVKGMYPVTVIGMDGFHRYKKTADRPEDKERNLIR